MRAEILTLLFAALIFSASCNTSSQGFIIDLDRSGNSINLKLSDILSDIAIVTLENKEDVLLSRTDKIAVTESYIIVAGQNGLHQFDRNGKYIKQLAIRGNGPNEFLRISSLLPDSHNNILYYKDTKIHDAFLSLDMNTGDFLGEHKIDVTGFSIDAVDKEGMIYGFPNVTPMRHRSPIDSITMVYRYDPAERSLTRFERDSEFAPRFAFGNTMTYYNNELYFMHIRSDTLYRIENSNTAPVHYFKYADRKTDFSSNGNYFRLLFKYKDGIVIQKCLNKTQIMGRGWIESNQPTGYYIIDNENNINSIGSLLIDPLQASMPVRVDEAIKIPVDYFPFPVIQGEWGHIVLDAISMITLLNRSLSGDGLSQEQRRQLELLSADLNDDSNPVLIIGKIE